jgi:hypothetical protein
MFASYWSAMDVRFSPPDISIGPDWQDLAGRSLAPAGPHAPELLLPAFGLQPGVLACVRDPQGLQLVLPLVKRRLLSIVHASHQTPLSLPALPLVSGTAPETALAAVLRRLASPVLLHAVPVDGPLWKALTSAAPRMAIIDRWERAVLKPQGTFDNWFEGNFDRKRRKEFRRLQSRLSEQGRFETLSFKADDDIATWTDELLTLEAAGWKGERGTALKAPALHDALRQLADFGKLRFWKMALDGRPLAMMFAIVDRDEAWLGKIAYDESFARFSPGVQLILHATAQLFAEGIRQADSCAIPDHPMINNIWRDRMTVADVLIAGPEMSSILFSIAAKGVRLRMNARARLRDIYYRLKGRHRS